MMSRFEAVFCDHSFLDECHDGCGHFSCPCGIYWDDGAESGPFPDEDYDFGPAEGA